MFKSNSIKIGLYKKKNKMASIKRLIIKIQK